MESQYWENFYWVSTGVCVQSVYGFQLFEYIRFATLICGPRPVIIMFNVMVSWLFPRQAQASVLTNESAGLKITDQSEGSNLSRRIILLLSWYLKAATWQKIQFRHRADILYYFNIATNLKLRHLWRSSYLLWRWMYDVILKQTSLL